jgi:hypothetical protein
MKDCHYEKHVQEHLLSGHNKFRQVYWTISGTIFWKPKEYESFQLGGEATNIVSYSIAALRKNDDRMISLYGPLFRLAWLSFTIACVEVWMTTLSKQSTYKWWP